MSVPKPTTGNPRSLFDSLEYWVFRWLVFILFLAAVYKLLDHELGVTDLLFRLSSAFFDFAKS